MRVTTLKNKTTVQIFLIVYVILMMGLFAKAQELDQTEKVTVSKPTFPKCTDPQGRRIVYYTKGIHGIPGDSSTYRGSDRVYKLTEDTLTQCFCSINDDGIQTNWWNVNSLSIEQIELLRAQGWIYIPNGAEWGLEEDPYLAKNTKFDCDPGDDDDEDDEDNKDDDDDDGDVLGTSSGRFGGILGLASTGNLKEIFIYAILSISSLYLSLYFHKKAKRY